MSVADQITSLRAARTAIAAAITAKGVTVPPGSGFADFAALIADIEGTDPTAPAAFTSGQWAVTATGATGAISINITALPDDGGSAITALQYRVDGGTATALTGTGTGARTVTGLTDDVEVDVEVRAVNAVGSGAWSDVKAVTPTVSAGGGPATWESVALTDDTGLVGGGTLNITLPTGGTSDDLMVLIMDGIEDGQRARLTPPSGWTFRFEYYNLDGFGATDASGCAIYTAPGNTTANTWSLSTGSTINAGWAVHLWSGVDGAAPIRGTIQVNDSNTWGTGNNMPSPTATPEEGDGVMAHLYHMQETTAFGTGFDTDFTREVHQPNPGRRSTLILSDAPAGATGTITHDSAGTFQARVALTIVLAAA